MDQPLAPAAHGTLHEISCTPECGFMVMSHDEEEVIELARQHVESKHPGMTLSRDDLRAKARSL